MSPSESSDEEPDFLWLQPTKEERTEEDKRWMKLEKKQR